MGLDARRRRDAPGCRARTFSRTAYGLAGIRMRYKNFGLVPLSGSARSTTLTRRRGDPGRGRCQQQAAALARTNWSMTSPTT